MDVSNIHEQIREVLDNLVRDYFPRIFGTIDPFQEMVNFCNFAFSVFQSNTIISLRDTMTFECYQFFEVTRQKLSRLLLLENTTKFGVYDLQLAESKTTVKDLDDNRPFQILAE